MALQRGSADGHQGSVQRRWRRWVAGSAVLLVTAALTASTAAPTVAAEAFSIRVGSRTLHRCDLGVGRVTWCGSLPVALDPTDPQAGRIKIGFGWVPATRQPDTARTVVAQEGGPGYPSTGTAADFATMLGPLLTERNLLVVDARGTGRSTPLDCPGLRTLPEPPSNGAFSKAVAACGAQLNHTFRRTASAGGGWVHASDLFTTANSARDLARVLDALGTGPVDLYGDSYGTYFAQSFMSRYPAKLRSVVLDSAYEARDLDPWYTTTVTTARRAFDQVCARAPACARATAHDPANSWGRIAQLAAALRSHPVSGRTTGTDGHTVQVRLDVTALVNIVNDAGYDTDPYRQLDAAARAYLQHRDAAPLLRLYAQDIGYDYSDYQADSDYYSDGLYMAVACSDYPQLFSMTSPPAARRAQLDAAIAALPADTFAPFTTREWLRVLPFTETYTGCLSWPAPTHPAEPPVPDGVSLDPGAVPVLILNGELDSLTPAAGGAHIASQIGPAARAVVAANNVHLVALYDRFGCGSHLVRAFLRHPDRLHTLNTSCAGRIPPVHAVGSYPGHTAQAPPARVVHGRAGIRLRRLATIATQAAGDAVARWDYIDDDHDRGLRGGTVTYTEHGDRTTATLHGVHWTRDRTVTGTVHIGADSLSAAAQLVIRRPGLAPVRLSVRWRLDASSAVARTSAATFRLPAP